MPCGIPACVTKIVHVSIKNINVPAKLVKFSFLWISVGSSRWERNLTADLPSCCILRYLAPRIMWWWRAPGQSCSGGRGPGGGGWGGEALHPSLSGLHATTHILWLWQGWGWRASRCTGAVPLSIVSGPLLAAWVITPLFLAVWILDLERLLLMFVVLYILLRRFLFSHFPV